MSVWSRITAPFRKRSYDGAGGGRRWRGRHDMPVPIAAQAAARGPLARRARYLVANNPLAASGVEAWVSALVGTGIKAQSNHADTAIRAQLGLAHEIWTDDVDADGLTDLYGLQAIMARRLVIDGEAFAVLVNDGGLFQVRLIDSEQVDPSLSRNIESGRIVQGIEFDNAGRRVAYHIHAEAPGLPFATVLPPVRVPAADVVHLFRPEIPGQVRGISWFAPVLLRMSDLDEWRDSQLMRQKVAALLTGFIRSTDGSASPFDGDRNGTDLVGGLTPGAMHYLDPNQDVTFSTPANIGAEVISFAKITEREIAVGLGLPAAVLTGDLSDVNYSSIRAGLVEWRRRVEALQHGVLAFQALRPIWRRWAATEVLSGRVSTTVAEAQAVKFIAPKTQWVDPLKDAQAEIAAIGAGLMSRREAVTSRGVDIEALDQEIADDKARAESLGLAFSASNDNNPAASVAA